MAKQLKVVVLVIAAAVAVDKSHGGLHKALCNLLKYAHKDGRWNLVSEYVQSRKDRGNKTAGVTTASVEKWLTTVAQLKISKDGEVSEKEGVEYNGMWMKACQGYPWYKVARDMQQFKVFESEKAAEQFGSALAKAEYLGEEINLEALMAVVGKAISATKANKRYKEWQSKARSEAKKRGLESVTELRAVA
jgi:hypothetical protein